jgi:hypothetical protein
MADSISITVAVLLADSGLSAVVPAENITPGEIPEGTTPPALGITHVSTQRRQTVSGQEGNTFCTSRVQVTTHASTYPQQRAVQALVRAAMVRKPVVADALVDGILNAGEGPDFRLVDPGIYAGSDDFVVTWTE